MTADEVCPETELGTEADQAVRLLIEARAERDFLRARIEAVQALANKRARSDVSWIGDHELNVALAGDQPVTPEPVRQLRECVVCGEKTTMSNATPAWEALHKHSLSEPPEATPALCRVCGNPRQESGHPECPSSHAKTAPEPTRSLKNGLLFIPCGAAMQSVEEWRADHLPACSICSGNFGAYEERP